MRINAKNYDGISLRRHRNANRMIVLSLCLVIVISMALLEFTNVTHFFHTQPVIFKPTPTTGGASAGNQKGEAADNTNATGSASAQPNDTNKGNTTPATVLIAPTGNFVSNHHPGQNSSSLIETSVCNTTSGAKCQISFTMNGAVHSLSAETTDAGGSAYWNDWTPQSIGLTPGSWQITATVTLGSQTNSTIDPQLLVVM